MKNDLFDYDGFLNAYGDMTIFELERAKRGIIHEQWEKDGFFNGGDLEDLTFFDRQITLKLLGKMIYKKRLAQEVICQHCGFIGHLEMRKCPRCGQKLKDTVAKQIELEALEAWSNFDWDDTSQKIETATPEAIHLFTSRRSCFYIPEAKQYYAVSRGDSEWPHQNTIIEIVTKQELLDVARTQAETQKNAGHEESYRYWEDVYYKLGWITSSPLLKED